jgi:hypothetical protein
MNLNVYAYCQGCGRGFAGPEEKPKAKERATRRRFWPFGHRAA